MYRRTITAGAVAGVLLLGAVTLAYAESDNEGKDNKGKGNSNVPANVQALQEQIKALQEQLKELHKKQTEAMKEFRSTLRSNDDDDDDDDKDRKNSNATSTRNASSTPGVSSVVKAQIKFLRSLSRGMSGDDVRDLQELLAQDSSIFPEALITGFFGELTERALKRYQEKYGIESIGVFGPKTQARILAHFANRELPPGIIKRLGLDGATTTPGTGLVAICHKPAGTSPQSLVIAVPALGAHLAHGDSVGVCPGSGTATTTPPVDTTKPVISNISVSGIASTSAMVSWQTNEAATGKVYYGTTTPVNFLTALTAGSATATTSHSFTLMGLMASTTHYYALESKDSAGNTATTSTQSFITAQ